MFLIKEICINEQQELSVQHIKNGGKGIIHNVDMWKKKIIIWVFFISDGILASVNGRKTCCQNLKEYFERSAFSESIHLRVDFKGS